jgi:hypothetical protein
MIDETSRTTAPRRAEWLLWYAALLYAVAFLLHTGDHFRRGLKALTPEVFWAGAAGTAAPASATALVLVGHRLAPLAAAAVGFAQALGVAAVHLPPRWGALSDSLPAGGADALSWAAALLERGGALVLGTAGAYALRRGARRPRDRRLSLAAAPLPDLPGHPSAGEPAAPAGSDRLR